MPLTRPGVNMMGSPKKVTKYLQSDLSSNDSDIADLKFTDLEVGKSYLMFVKAQAAVASNSSFQILVKNGLNTLVEFQGGTPTESGSDRHTAQGGTTFVAVASTMITEFLEYPTAVLEGAGNYAGTWISIEEIADLEEVGSF